MTPEGRHESAGKVLGGNEFRFRWVVELTRLRSACQPKNDYLTCVKLRRRCYHELLFSQLPRKRFRLNHMRQMYASRINILPIYLKLHLAIGRAPDQDQVVCENHAAFDKGHHICNSLN